MKPHAQEESKNDVIRPKTPVTDTDASEWRTTFFNTFQDM